MTAVWRPYLVVGVATIVVQMMVPLGLGRDLFYGLIGASGVAAIVVGVRLHRPSNRTAWYLIAAAIAALVLGDLLHSWHAQVTGIDGMPTISIGLYAAAYPLLAAGFLAFVRSRRHVPRRRWGPDSWPNALLDSAILTVGVGLAAWVFVIEPAWEAGGATALDWLVPVAYPIGDGLLFAMMVRLVAAPGAGRIVAGRLLVSAAVIMLVTDLVSQTVPTVPRLDGHTTVLEPLWLVAYVLWGAAALHASMGGLSTPPVERGETTQVSRVVTLAATTLIGPTILAAEQIAGVPIHLWTVIFASVVVMSLFLARMVRIVRKLERQSRRLVQRADIDFVTGLANSHRFVERVGALLGSPEPAAGLFLIDLERFTELNDTLGHRTGDAILHTVGARLSTFAGSPALVARTGRHTFAVLTPAIASSVDVDAAAVRIRSVLESPLELPDLDFTVDVSVGALLLPDDGDEPRLVLRRADLALAAAKAQPGRTARFTAELVTGGTLAPLLIGELNDALEQGDIVLYYQPLVEVRTGRVLGVEALARWQHPRHGLLGPDSFVIAAEETGIIGPLTHYVLDAALAQSAQWRRAGLVLTVAVNLSVRNLLDHGLVEDVRAALLRHGVVPQSLELELTESSAMVDPRRSMQVLGALADMGVTLSIDDYGTGHSSLAYLQRLPVRRLKIDRSFVTGMVHDSASAAIVHSTIELARHLHLDVIAEGVEDDATLGRLRDMQCFAAQGFGLGRPVSASLIPRLIAEIEGRLPEVLGAPSPGGAHRAVGASVMASPGRS